MAQEETGRLQRAAFPRSRQEHGARREPPPADDSPEREEAQRSADRLVLLRRMAGRPASEVLARIADGDLLRLFPRCAQRLRETCYILDPERVFERALAEVAVSLEIEGERCAEPSWLLECVDRAIQSVLERDRREEHEGVPPVRPEAHYPLFIECCQIEPGLARSASVRYNDLDPRIRKSFQHLIVEAQPLDAVLAMGLGPPERLQLDILHALRAIGLVDDADIEHLRMKTSDP